MSSPTLNPHRAFNSVSVPNWLAEQSEINGDTKLAYALLTSAASENGVAEVSPALASRRLGVPLNQYLLSIDKLCRVGLIEPVTGGYAFLRHHWMASRVEPVAPVAPQRRAEAEPPGDGEIPFKSDVAPRPAAQPVTTDVEAAKKDAVEEFWAAVKHIMEVSDADEKAVRGMAGKLLKLVGDPAKALPAVERAAHAVEPVEFLGGCLRAWKAGLYEDFIPKVGAWTHPRTGQHYVNGVPVSRNAS